MTNRKTKMTKATVEPGSPTLYAVVDVYWGVVYGTGRTAQDAIDAAVSWGFEGPGFFVVPITDAAFDHVDVHGGAQCLELVVTRDGVCLRSEEE